MLSMWKRMLASIVLLLPVPDAGAYVYTRQFQPIFAMTPCLSMQTKAKPAPTLGRKPPALGCCRSQPMVIGAPDSPVSCWHSMSPA